MHVWCWSRRNPRQVSSWNCTLATTILTSSNEGDCFASFFCHVRVAAIIRSLLCAANACDVHGCAHAAIDGGQGIPPARRLPSTADHADTYYPPAHPPSLPVSIHVFPVVANVCQFALSTIYIITRHFSHESFASYAADAVKGTSGHLLSPLVPWSLGGASDATRHC